MDAWHRIISAIAVAACILFTGCPTGVVIPSASMLTGEAGGCGNSFVYRFNDTRTLAVTIRVDEAAHDLFGGPVKIEIGPQTTSAAVEVLQFGKPAVDYFCDDVGGDAPPVAQWKAVAGEVIIERLNGTPPAELSNATHKVSVQLKNVQLKNIKTSHTTMLNHLQIKDVWVGWLAG